MGFRTPSPGMRSEPNEWAERKKNRYRQVGYNMKKNNPFLITTDLVASEHWGTGHHPRPPAPKKLNKTIHIMKLTLRKNPPSLVTVAMSNKLCRSHTAHHVLKQ